MINDATERRQKKRYGREKIVNTKVRCVLGKRPKQKQIDLLMNALIQKKIVRIRVNIKSQPKKIYEYGNIEGSHYRKLIINEKPSPKIFFKNKVKENLEDMEIEIAYILFFGNPFGDPKTINKVVFEYLSTGGINLDGITLEDLSSKENKDFRNCNLLRAISVKRQSKIFNILFDKLNNREETSHDK